MFDAAAFVLPAPTRAVADVQLAMNDLQDALPVYSTPGANHLSNLFKKAGIPCSKVVFSVRLILVGSTHMCLTKAHWRVTAFVHSVAMPKVQCNKELGGNSLYRDDQSKCMACSICCSNSKGCASSALDSHESQHASSAIWVQALHAIAGWCCVQHAVGQLYMG